MLRHIERRGRHLIIHFECRRGNVSHRCGAGGGEDAAGLKEHQNRGDKINRLPTLTNTAFEYIEGEGILLLLNKDGIAASSGSACTSGSLEPSHVMKAMGIPYTAAHGTVRFSFSHYNTMEEVERVIEVVPPIVERLRKLSPYWGEDGPVEQPEQAFQPGYA